MNNKLISIIIPVYNKEHSIKRCINSVLNQTYKNIEIIIVDDGSTDNSLSICREMELTDYRIKVVSKENGGVSSARNKGISISKGQYIGFVDADDWIDKAMYEKLYKAINLNKADIASCYFSYEKDEIIRPLTYKQYKYEKEVCLNVEEVCNEISKIYCRKIGWENCNKLFDIRVLKDIRYDSKITNGEDWLFFCESLILTKKLVSIPDNLYHYVYEENSASNCYKSTYLSACEASEKALALNLPFNKKSNNNIKESIAQTAAICLYNWRKNKNQYKKEIESAKKYLRKYRKYVYFNKEVKLKRKIKFIIYANINRINYKRRS